MKKTISTLSSLMFILPLVGCGATDDSKYGHETPIDLKMPSNVSKYDLDTTDYSTQEEKTTDTVKIYYHRNDNDEEYSNYYRYRLWIWDKAGGGNGWWYEFSKYNEYGVIAEIPLKDITGQEGKLTSEIGMVITTCQSQTATWEGTYSKDPDGDIIAEINATNKGGVQCIYTISKKVRAFYSLTSPFRPNLSYVRYSSENTIYVSFDTPDKQFAPKTNNFEMKINGEPYTGFSVGHYDSANYCLELSTNQKIKITDSIEVIYHFSDERQDSSFTILTKYYDEPEFINKYSYTGNDLGATFDNDDTPTKTIFKVWSPVSSSMQLNIFNTGDYRNEIAPSETYPMSMGEKGVWEVTVNKNLENKYYTYTVTNRMGTNEVVDPYAKSAGLNGRRGMIVNFKKINSEIPNWDKDIRPNYGENATDASISEIHVRDMTINPNSGVSPNNRGKFLGLAEKNTSYTENNITVSTGLSHLKELGITHVQIQPMYDYSSVNEETSNSQMSKDNYNWGYDPLNYNCLEGSYSSNPIDGLVRIKEAKQMIMALHEEGIGVIMDVVYNHTSSFQGSNFELLMPEYYHRTKASGVAYNGSGCGNEMASERFMVNKFMRDSCKFWIDEYHISGYRFDLMGLMDNQVMIDIYNDCHNLYDKVIIYGEPWTGGTSKLKSGIDSTKLTAQQTVQTSLGQSYFVDNEVYVGAFSDGFRNAVRGDNSPNAGWVTGNSSSANNILPGIQGKFATGNNAEPRQVVNYVSCHDNYTLYDQIVQTIPNSRNLIDAYLQAEAVVYLSQGIAFMQEGEEFMRSKYDEEANKYIGNSYNVGDYINNMDYSLKVKNIDVFNKFKQLVAFRKENDAFTLPNAKMVSSSMKNVKATNGNITYEVSYQSHVYYVIHALNSGSFTLPGTYSLVFSTQERTLNEQMNKINAHANETLVFKK